MGGRSRAKEQGPTSLGIRLDAEEGVKRQPRAEASHGGKSSCTQALPLSCPPLPSCKSGGALLASTKSFPNASREDRRSNETGEAHGLIFGKC